MAANWNWEDRDARRQPFDLLTPVENLLSWAQATIATWMQRARDRHDLANLSELQRRDMGLARDAIDLEVRKPFWRA
jgi:uncharacterized protein YjiS (DUF1127 family)